MSNETYVSIKTAAEILKVTVDGLIQLHDAFMGPRVARPASSRPFRLLDVLRYKFANLIPTPRGIFHPDEWNERFSKHDDGRWWPIVSYDKAVRIGKRRYFNGTPCELDHRTEWFIKNQKCVECCEVNAGRGAKSKLAQLT